MLRDLKYAAALARHSGYRRAAQSLDISQSKLSRAIQALEERLGLTLFERSASGATLTPEGRLALEAINNLLKAEQVFDTKISQIRRRSAEAIRVGVGPVVQTTWGPDAVSNLARVRPDVELSIREVEWWKLPDAALGGEFDIVFGECSEAEANPEIVIERFPERAAGLFVRAGHPLDGVTNVTLARLIDYPLAAPRLPGRIGRFIGVEGKLGRMSSSDDHFLPMIETTSPKSIVDIVRVSNAVGLSLRSLCAEALAERTIVELPFSAPWLSIRQGIMHRRGLRLSPATRALCAAAKAAERAYFTR